MGDYKDLDVWKKCVSFVLTIYETVKNFPQDERYALTDQMKRAVISIPSNIAEGASRNTKKEFIQFLYIASGSASELETQIIIARELNYINDVTKLIAELTIIRKMINALISSLKR